MGGERKQSSMKHRLNCTQSNLKAIQLQNCFVKCLLIWFMYSKICMYHPSFLIRNEVYVCIPILRGKERSYTI